MNTFEKKETTLAKAEVLATGKPGDATTVRAKIPYVGLRDWIDRVKELGELRIAKGLNWQSEIGLVSELAIRDEKGPCIIFEDIPGTLPGSRVLVNFFGGKRQNMTLGFSPDLAKLALTEAFRLNYLAELRQVPHRFVEDGPIFENVVLGDDVDVTQFPAPIWHEADGGRYIGTGSFNVTRDPDEGWINCGTYRVVIHDGKSVGFYISPGKHGRMQRDKYGARGEPMPVAIVAGGDPLTFLMGCTEVPYGVCEYDAVGGIRGAPVDVVKSRITGLPIPATAEIVLEGFVYPGNVKPEGPFGEWMGYYGTEVRDEPVMDVKAIYHRNNPILLGCPPLRPPDEIARLKAIIRSGMLRENLTRAGVPDVTATWAHEVGTSRLLLGGSDQATLSGSRHSSRTYRMSMSRRGICRPIRDRRRRRHRRLESRGAHLGDADPLGSGHIN